MTVQRIAAFSNGDAGGNPAGVMLAGKLPPVEEMQKIAADVGYSETAFAAPQDDFWRVRYFAPEGEVPFCGHATIALGAVLGAAHGAGLYQLHLNDAKIDVTCYEDGTVELTSPPTGFESIPKDQLASVLALFGWSRDSVAKDVVPAIGLAGSGRFLLLPLERHQDLREMHYDQAKGRALMQALDIITINLFWRATDRLIHSRNPFAGHGVYEDPATGAAASALAGYLRDTGHCAAPFEILQGADMGVPSRLHVAALKGVGAPVKVSGRTRIIKPAP